MKSLIRTYTITVFFFAGLSSGCTVKAAEFIGSSTPLSESSSQALPDVTDRLAETMLVLDQ